MGLFGAGKDDGAGRARDAAERERARLEREARRAAREGRPAPEIPPRDAVREPPPVPVDPRTAVRARGCARRRRPADAAAPPVEPPPAERPPTPAAPLPAAPTPPPVAEPAARGAHARARARPRDPSPRVRRVPRDVVAPDRGSGRSHARPARACGPGARRAHDATGAGRGGPAHLGAGNRPDPEPARARGYDRLRRPSRGAARRQERVARSRRRGDPGACPGRAAQRLERWSEAAGPRRPSSRDPPRAAPAAAAHPRRDRLVREFAHGALRGRRQRYRGGEGDRQGWPVG